MSSPPDQQNLSPTVHVWEEAAGYDRWFETRWGRYAFDRESRAVQRAVGPGRVPRIVDVGCGTGRFTDRLGDMGTSLFGLDRELAMLRYSQSQTLLPLVAADALALPLRDDTVDVAVAITVLEFVSDPALAMAEMARVVRPGGRLVVGALNPHSPWGLAHRGEFAEAPWNTARFLTRAELRTLGRPHGSVELRGALYAPGGLPFLRCVVPLLERFGRAAPAWGAFQVLVVETNPVGAEKASPTR